MSHKKNRYEGYSSYEDDREQPEGWFDPKTYADNRNMGRQDSNEQWRSNMGRGREQRGLQYGGKYENRNDSSRMRNENFRNEDYDRYNRPFDPDNGRQIKEQNQWNYRNNEGNRYDHNAERREDDRDWWDRASDEVASWFGNDEAERRRRMDKISGPHKGKGPKGYLRSDEKICEEINERLYHDTYIDASDIEVKVTNGEAILSGTVDSRETKRRAEDIAESIGGVKDVENHLKVNRENSDVSIPRTEGNYGNGYGNNRNRNSFS